jgi:demethylmenaquinone methyltransferase/2-methoxy-6-polyprenyl-1,4-benzoquinol methylase
MRTDGSGAMFDAIAARYDLLNRLLSLGIDRRWRRRAIAALALSEGARVLDVATGTADVAIALARRGAEVVGLDPSPGMLAVGARKLGAAGLDARVRLVLGRAEALPFPDASFDGVTLAFGIRNVADRPRALAELARVSRRGARVAVLELAEPRGRVLGPLARFHIHRVVPRIGAALSGARAYGYLQRSIAAFPSAEEFAGTLGAAGLRVIDVRPLTFGVCTLFVAEAGT